jgi:hypothetical protein
VSKSKSKTAATPRAIVDDVLGRGMTRRIWSGNYEHALPVSIQDFDFGAVLPAVFYMFRFAHRRGKGHFLEVFGEEISTARRQKQVATIESVALALTSTSDFDGFTDDTTKAILGDLLLCFCLENAKRALGRNQQILRVAPTHYMSSWVDLPTNVVNLRYVPEMIVAMLADQKGAVVEPTDEDSQTWFSVGRGFDDNVLLRAFHRGVERDGPLADRKGDRFVETTSDIGLDQLLMIRLAQQLESAPDKIAGSEGEKISNQRPIAKLAARHFSEDIRQFVRAYAEVIPRHAFVEMLEACMAVGLTTIVTSTIDVLFEWADSGTVPQTSDQKPTHLFVDCSNGVDRRLRALAEQSMDDFMRRIERIPVVMMALRLLDHGAQFDPRLKKLKLPTRPYATEWINLLGELLNGRRSEADAIIYDLERRAHELAEAFTEDYPEASESLTNDQAQPNPVWRLAETLTVLQGRRNTQQNVITLIDSSLMTGRPNGLAAKRSVIRTVAGAGTKKKRDVRSVVFTDAVLDHLVHRHVLRNGQAIKSRPVAFSEFLMILTERHGFCVDTSPPGMTVSNELLRENRAVLERRLRDLGLLVGVNDAESMKSLKPRFPLG